MDLLNVTVLHKVWGEGVIIKQESKYITVKFKKTLPKKDDDTVKLGYLNVFGDGSLKITDNDTLQELVVKDVAEKKKIEFEKRYEELCRIEEEKVREREVTKPHIGKTSSNKQYEEDNIAFKCNYCNGGASDEQVGFAGVCSKEIIHYNIEVEKRSWCSQFSKCRKYMDGEISYEQLLDDFKNGEFVCYESTMLTNWKALAGIDKDGKNKRIRKIKRNGLCVLTMIEPDASEESRSVFGVFLVGESYAGDDTQEGYVAANSQYKLKLTPEESKQILFWNYYKNGRGEKNCRWSSLLHRYMNDIVSAQLLRDIAHVKKNTPDEDLAQEFFVHYCEENKIDINNIPEKNGALVIK